MSQPEENPKNSVHEESDQASPPLDIEKGPIQVALVRSQPPPPPDGGLWAWLCVLGSFCATFVSFGFISACGIFQLYYEEVLLSDHDASSISWIITIAIFAMYVVGAGVGRLADVVHPRIVLIPASILIVFAICMLSLSTQYYQIMLTEGVTFGIGAGCLFLIPIVSVSQWFSSKRGLAVGLTTCGSSLGGIIFPIMIPKLIDKHGFAASVRWTALLMGCMLAITCLTITRPYPPPPKGAQKKAGSGLEPLKALKNWSWIFFFIGAFLIMWGFFAPYNYLPLFASLRAHTGKDMSNYLVSIIAAGSTVGRIVPGWLSDKFGQFNVMMSVAALSGISILVFWLPLQYHPSNAAIIAFGAVYGFVSGGYISLLSPCIAKLCRGQLQYLGIRMGAFFVVIAFASLTGLPILGAIKDNAGADDFVGLIIFGGIVMTIGGVFVCFCSFAFDREKVN